jgi:ribonuclease HII
MPANRKFDPSLLPELPDLSFEQTLWAQGLRYVGGVDEAGRGALAGPVYAAVVILPFEPDLSARLNGVDDSKQLSPVEREHWADQIRQHAFSYGIGSSTCQEIDRLGIVTAVRLAIQRAVGRLSVPPQHLLVDYLDLPELFIPQTPLVKGDARSLSIAAASVLAKTERDAFMRQLNEEYPQYHLAQNKGYGTQKHRNAIRMYGMSSVHRKTFVLHEQ